MKKSLLTSCCFFALVTLLTPSNILAAKGEKNPKPKKTSVKKGDKKGLPSDAQLAYYSYIKEHNLNEKMRSCSDLLVDIAREMRGMSFAQEPTEKLIALLSSYKQNAESACQEWQDFLTSNPDIDTKIVEYVTQAKESLESGCNALKKRFAGVWDNL
ncbi:MAG: hypothetical protein H6679_03775 [Epsilonproteobacteria bacterium]|nr:hypothetical protein [Campylobacterota bacterium]